MSTTERVRTPPVGIDVALWLNTLPAGDVAFVAGAAFALLARHAGMTEADLFADWARRAAEDPDCQVIR